MLVVAERDQLPVAEARTGDPAAWDALFHRYQLPLYVYVFELVHDEQASLDIVQETFINAVRHIGCLREDDKIGGWLFGIAHQKCVQRWRKQTREENALEEVGAAPPEFEAGPDDLLIRHENEEAFVRLLNELPPPQRSVLLLYFVEDFSVDEIAKITGAPPGTVKSRLYCAKKAVRKRMEDPWPRDILFERHRPVEPRLDALRRKVLAERLGEQSPCLGRNTRNVRAAWQARDLLRRAWLGLVWPSRHAWAGMGALWLVIVAANLHMKAASPAVPLARAEPAAALAQAFAEQRRVLAELLPPAKPRDIQAARPGAGRRSEHLRPFKAC